MKDLARLVVVLTLFAAVAGLMLALTNKATLAPIAASRQAENLAALSEVLPEFDNQPMLATNAVSAGGGTWVFYVARKGGAYAGAAVEAESRKGYGGPIRLMVGVRADGAVNRVRVLSHQETPGLGSKVALSPFKDQFAGKPVAGTRWAVRKDGGDVDAITGATISSRAVVEAVRTGIEVYRANMDAIARTEAPAASGGTAR